MFQQKGVLLCLAEVRIPLRHLEKSDLNRIGHVCYRKLLSFPAVDDDETVKCIGVVDRFYALQEVELTIDDGLCKLSSRKELILRHHLSNVLTAVHAEDNNSRIIVLSKTENFGPAAVILQLIDKKAVDLLIEQLCRVDYMDARKENYFKRETGSFGKSVHKKLNSLLSYISPHTEEGETRLTLPRTISAPVSPIELSEEDEYTSEADDESSSPEEDLNESFESPVNFDRNGGLSLHINALSPIEAEIEFLLESEKNYLESLQHLIAIQREIESTNFIVDYPSGIFDSVAELSSLHTKLYADLASCKHDAAKLCSVLTANNSEFDAYISFIGNIPTVEKILEMNRHIIGTKFPTLTEDLRKPRMRLNFYVLSLESLLKKTPADARDAFSECIAMLKDKLKEADTRLVIDSIHGATFDLREYGRIVFSSELTLKRGGGLVRSRYQAILLENILVLAKGTPQFSEYVTCFSLPHMQLVRQMRGLFIYLKLRTHGKSSTILFKAASIKLQQKWMDLLQSQIYSANKEYLRAPLVEHQDECMLSKETKDAEVPTINIVDYDRNQDKKDVNITLPPNAVAPKIPPLSFWGAFSSVVHLLQLQALYTYEENLQAFVKSAREMKVQQALNDVKNEKAKDTIILLKEFYTKQLVPSVNLSVFNQDDILFVALGNSADYFKNLVIKLAYYFSVISYESYAEIPKVFLCAIETIVYLRNAFICRDVKSEEERKNYERIEKMFSEAILISNNKLKRRYASNIPARLSIDLVHEGVLAIHPGTKLSKNVYVFLTEDRLFGFDMLENTFLMNINLDLDDAIISTSSSDLLFQIMAKTSDSKREKYEFGCSTKRDKKEWISALGRIAHNDNTVKNRWH